jgi:hypothetical protein
MWAELRTRWVAFATLLVTLAGIVRTPYSTILWVFVFVVVSLAIAPDIPKIKNRFSPNKSRRALIELRRQLLRVKQDILADTAGGLQDWWKKYSGGTDGSKGWDQIVVDHLAEVSPERAERLAQMLGHIGSTGFHGKRVVTHQIDIILEQLEKAIEES